MTEEIQPAAISSAFPAPPPFYKSFTSQNLDLLQKHLESLGQRSFDTFRPTDPISTAIPDNSSIPTELRKLIPPPPPADGTYLTFGTLHNINPVSTTDLTPPPSQDHLLSLLHQILLKFLHITHILSIDPAMKFYGPAWDQLEALFKGLHEGINAWRPHQARETLLRMIEEQIREVKSETQKVRDGVEKAKGVVNGIAEGTGQDEENGSVNVHQNPEFRSEEASKKKEIQRDRMLWKVIDSTVDVI
ncbi:MAG: hypothetical protein Q9217_002534 [Psora testacea]